MIRIRSRVNWIAIITCSIVLLSACGGSGSGGGNSGGGSGGTAPVGFSVFTSDRNQSGTVEPWVATFDGSDYRSLAAGLPAGGNILTSAARLSPDGRYLGVVTDDGTEHRYAIVEVASGNAQLLPMIGDKGVVDANITFLWSPDSSRAVLTTITNGNRHTYVMDADGSNVFELLFTGADGLIPHSWSPGGTHFVVGSTKANADDNQKLFMVSADGASAVDIVPSVGFRRDVSLERISNWSADGLKAVFVFYYFETQTSSTRIGRILTNDLNTGITTTVTFGDHVGQFRGMSADGNWIAYEDLTQDRRVHLIPAAGGAPVPVSPAGNTHNVRDITWAPSGARLAYNLDTNSVPLTRTLHIADSTGTSMAVHSPGEIAATTFSWSPDGRYLAFTVADASTNHPLYVLDSTSTSLPILITSEAELSQGASALGWSPNSQWLYAEVFDAARQSYVVRAYPVGLWSSGQTLGDISPLDQIAPKIPALSPIEQGVLALSPTPDSSGVVWRRADSSGAIDVMHGNPVDPTLTRSITQIPLPGADGQVLQLFAR